MRKYILLLFMVLLCSYTGMAQTVLTKSGKQTTINTATPTAAGTIQLAGDLTGLATAPTIATGAVTTTKIANSAVDLTTKVSGILPSSKGGTGVDNTGKSITLGGNLTTSGAFPITLTTIGGTNVVLPPLGTLATTTGIETLTNKNISGATITGGSIIAGTVTGFTQPSGNATDLLATTSFVSTAVANGAPDATTLTKGKIQLANELGGTATAPTITNAAVINKLLTGYSSTAGTVAATDNIVTAIGKLNGNDALKSPLESPVFTGTPTLPTGTIGVTQTAGNNTTALATTAFVTTAVNSATTPDATTLATGKIQLAGDLSGTATSPTIASGAVTSAKILDGTIAAADIASGAVDLTTKVSGILPSSKGGTGVDNTGKSITLGGNLTTSGAFATTLTSTAATNVTLPTTGTLATLAGTETLTNKTISGGIISGGCQITSTVLGFTQPSGNATNLLATTSFVSTAVANGAPDATTLATGKVQLAGDLTGLATAPTIAANAVTTAKILDNTITNADLNTGVGGIYKSSGSLTGNTTVTQGVNTLNFISAATTGTSHFTVDGTTLNVDAVNNRVGIGTATPSAALEVSQGTPGNSGLRFTNLNSDSAASTSSSKVLGLNSTGDVILTNVPGTQDIVSFTTAIPSDPSVVFTPNTPKDQTVIYQSEVDNSLWTYNGTAYVSYVAPASTAWNLANTTNDAGSNKISSIWRSGNIGINTNNPSEKLDVTGNIKFSGALMPNNTAGSSGAFLQSAGAGSPPTWVTPSSSTTPNIYTSNGTVTGARTVTQGANPIEFQSTAAHNITITRGTSDPNSNAIVSINKTLNNNPAINTALTSGSGIGGIIFRAANGSSYNESAAILSSVSENQTTTAGGGELSFQTRNNGNGNTLAEKMRINNAGNVGIGIAVPTQKLDVVGNVKFSGALMPNNSAGTSGQVLTSSGAGTPPTWSSATTRVLGYVGRGSDIILGNLKVRLAATGNVSLQVSTVAGVISILGPSYFGNGNDYYISNMVVTTTPTYLNSNATTPSAGELIKAELMDVNNLISWRITAITGSGYNNNFICIEKL